ncbi:DUF1800 domain-containing protein [uncultured Friedmanniella sp.]|uniref:DUF1800 domain-containing protein n=1 Tax=uncultured Friedmanniella sp. TaxID=335381 RepID=UPI0035CB7517
MSAAAPTTGGGTDDLALLEQERPASRSRRAVLFGAGTGAALSVGALTETAEAATADPVLHLLRRATYGPTPALVKRVRAQGTTAWLESQLKPASIKDAKIDSLMPRWPGRDWTSLQVRQQLDSVERWAFMYGVVERHIARAIWSERQLLEMMVGFWTNHLVVPVPTAEVYDSAHLYQRDVIRAHALGRYSDLLWAAVRHPALLRILDLANSTKNAPNENHARELLELHTVGVGNYAEPDVINAACALTGLGIDDQTGAYVYRPQQHWVGAVKVLDWSHPNASAAGEPVAKSLITHLARQPATARRIATKLAVRFVSDNPSASLVDKLAKTYLDQDTSITAVLRVLFTSPEFARSANQKVRTPFEDVIATLRVLGAQPDASGTAGLHTMIGPLLRMGQLPMNWAAPDGFPDTADAWTTTSTTLWRWNFHVGAVVSWNGTALPTPKPRSLLPTTLPKTYRALLDGLAARLCLTPLSASQRAALCRYLDHAPTDRVRSTDPVTSWRLPHLVAVLLDSPNFTTR